MGRWGHGFFEGDEDWDYVGEIEVSARCKLHNPKRSRDKVAESLNNGLSEKLFEKFKDSPPYITFLGLLLMENGAKLSKSMEIQFLNAVQKTPLYDRMAEQLDDVVPNYKAGTPWDFGSRGLFEVLVDHIAEGKTGLVNV
jgi:hypothetical protein